MTQPQPNARFTIKEGSGIVVLSRVVDYTGAKILKASVSSANYYVYDLDTSLSQPTLKASGSVTISTAWADVYSVVGWTADSTGWNVAVPIPASAFTSALSRVRGAKFQVEIIATPTSGDQFWVADLTIDCQDGLSRGT